MENNEEVRKCLNCGTILSKDEDFCSKCGIKYGETKKIICKNCGNEIEFGKKFCGKCGTKVEMKITQKIDNAKNILSKKNTLKKIGIAVICIILLIGVFNIGKKVYNKISISIDELIAQEKYEEAYKKAKKEEKNKVIDEMIKKGKFEEAYNLSKNEEVAFINEIACYCNEISEGLKDSSSFLLRSIYRDKDNKRIVFSVNGKNSYGGLVVGYWYYTYSSSENKYTLYTTVSSLDEEKTYSWDDSSEKLEKTLKNLARVQIRNIISDENKKMDNSIVDAINTLFKNESNSVGNKQDYEMYSLDFEEFLWAKGYSDNQINDLLKNIKFPNYVISDTNNNNNNNNNL